MLYELTGKIKNMEDILIISTKDESKLDFAKKQALDRGFTLIKLFKINL